MVEKFTYEVQPVACHHTSNRWNRGAWSVYRLNGQADQPSALRWPKQRDAGGGGLDKRLRVEDVAGGRQEGGRDQHVHERWGVEREGGEGGQSGDQRGPAPFRQVAGCLFQPFSTIHNHRKLAPEIFSGIFAKLTPGGQYYKCWWQCWFTLVMILSNKATIFWGRLVVEKPADSYACLPYPKR